jgi:hypothetical protein
MRSLKGFKEAAASVSKLDDSTGDVVSIHVSAVRTGSRLLAPQVEFH